MGTLLRQIAIEEGHHLTASAGSVGADKKTIALFCKKLAKGKSINVIADELEEDISVIEPICKTAESFAPDYDPDKIYEALKK